MEAAQGDTCQSIIETWIKGYLYASLSGIVFAYIVLSLRAQKLSASSSSNQVVCIS